MSDEELKQKLKDFGLRKAEKYAKSGLDDVEELAELMVNHSETPFDNVGFEFLKQFKAQADEFLDKIYVEKSKE